MWKYNVTLLSPDQAIFAECKSHVTKEVIV
jgi:hypothetical protein